MGVEVLCMRKRSEGVNGVLSVFVHKMCICFFDKCTMHHPLDSTSTQDM